jgi:outer membrane protein assembly factor BamB
VAGTLYRIDLATGAKEDQFSFSGVGSRQGYAGVGGSPAVVGGRVYFSALTGKLYCLDASSFALQWVTDLRHTDLAHNQPVEHGGAAKSEGWSSPLVANGRVYVGFGEGEDPDGVAARYGFVYCLDAASGNVVWLFCTNHFGGGDNNPNVIPPATFSGVPPAPFTKAANNPVNTGAAPWSSAAYDAGLDRIYIGTGNAKPDDPLPDPKYASGMLSLDASTGEFKKFFQPAKSDNYRPNFDMDVDVPGGPTVFSRNGQRVVGIGTKGGSYFVLNAASLAVLQRRQLLPYDSSGNPFPNIDPTFGWTLGENKYGMFGTAAIHPGLEQIFVPFGGYSSSIDSTTTPFMRALDWNTLDDAWLTAGTNPPKYTVPVPPMYLTPGEAGLSSPAVVNDVVFVSTTKPGLYGLRATDGLCLWAAPGFGPGTYCIGPAVHGSYVVAGTGSNLYIYSL